MKGLSALATAFIVILMTIICADIVVRNGFGGSLPLASELGAMMAVLIAALQLPSAISAGRLTQVEIFIGALEIRRPRVAAPNAVLCLAGCVIPRRGSWHGPRSAFCEVIGPQAISSAFRSGTLPTHGRSAR
ncbi:MAG: TRAP transporter small permease subunit [Candidatus Devosia euplotis]|nr:TRAP transporter small permease subunit [Candidatus Devosia euplotis]